ncbi:MULTISPECIES: ClpXP protease specificity-enhancing factor [unclassified Halomonas]|uniref:ClpXP protease specificity-enhancing factor n=1 Tax=unclassified Halomonas TaxID=2609666 RepID=UPI0021E47FB4|nr:MULTISPECIES: ClpXP protease specificity-enhancing factor [unclassified Halomonas]UYF98537.1 ClpXP protease specificity-enhancing factor [Halomonas sp. GD1P12]WNL40350.1 ClpXP protease specificity-enhancing factor [Halomonas sp. PAMB 3232]WNL43681.1 ClpXP protease specificity-enhancing factor [Halomonas sp. PAMB 3264]
MKSSRPYIARALYQWLLDNELTPHLVVDATQPGVEVPRQFVQNGQIVLNVAPTAVRDLFMENEAIGFSARFGGQPMQVMVPIEALIAIYARENGAGMVFGQEPELDSDDEELETSEIDESESTGPQLSVTGPADESQGDAPSKEKGKAKKKPTLRVVK